MKRFLFSLIVAAFAACGGAQKNVAPRGGTVDLHATDGESEGGESEEGGEVAEIATTEGARPATAPPPPPSTGPVHKNEDKKDRSVRGDGRKSAEKSFGFAGGDDELADSALGGLGTGGGGGDLDSVVGTVGSDRPKAVREEAVREVKAPAMKAGRHDDNKQYNRFLSFLGENEHHVIYSADISERLIITIQDEDGNSLPNCRVAVSSGGKTLSQTVTYADGRTLFFPADASKSSDRDYSVRAACGKESRNGQLKRDGKRETIIKFPSKRVVPKPLPVDIAIVLDTSGSMQNQIDRLKETLKAIHFQLSNLHSKPDIQFALVGYRDRGDDYITQVMPFTRKVSKFQKVLDKLDADGGGDTPEDLQAALDQAMHKLDWRTGGLRLGFIVSDAIPHTDYGQKYTYESTMRESLKRGIKWTTVGAGGLGRDGEVIFRQIAQFSMGEYVFITQGGGGNAEGGVGEASHHVGSNYSTENLDQAIVRIVRREVSYMTNDPRDFDDTIVATATKSKMPRDKVLAPAVAEVMRQLADYSVIRLDKGTSVAVMPVESEGKGNRPVAEYITEQMIFAASRNPAFKVVERDLNEVGQELKLQLSDMFDVEETVQVGKMVGAEVLIVAKLKVHERGATLFARLIRVETGEMLSVAKVDMNTNVLHSS